MGAILKRCYKNAFYLLAIGIVCFAVVLNVARLFTAHLNAYRGRFEHWASHVMHRPVKIGEINGFWRGFSPEIQFANVTVYDQKKTQVRVQVDHLMIRVGIWKSIIWRHLIPSAIAIRGVDLTLADSQELQTQSINGFFLWLLSRPRVVGKDIQLTWKQLTGAPLIFKNLQFSVENWGIKHHLNGSALLGDKKLATISVIANLVGKIRDTDSALHFSGRSYVIVKSLPISSLSRWFDRWEVKKGRTNLTLWMNWKAGGLTQVHGMVDAKGVKWTPGQFFQRRVADVPAASISSVPAGQEGFGINPLWINRLQANVNWQRQAEGWQVATDHLRLVIAQKPWPDMQASYHWIQKTEKHPEQHIFSVNYFPLSKLWHFSHQLAPWSKAWRSRYFNFAPRGRLHHIQITQTVSSNDPYHIALEFDDVHLHRVPYLGEVTGLSGSLKGTLHSASVHLFSKDVRLSFEDYLRRPVDLTQIFGDLAWSAHADQTRFTAKNLLIQNQDLRLLGGGMLALSPKQSPRIETRFRFRFPDVRNLHDYLPRPLVPKSLYRWLTQVFLKGAVEEGTFYVNGALDRFPFRDKPENFAVNMQLRNMDLHYAPGWPSLQGLDAQLRVRGSRMDIKGLGARITAIPIEALSMHIDDLARPPINITLNTNLDLKEGVALLRQSPIKLGRNLEAFSISGPGRVAFKVKVDTDKPKLAVDVAGKLSLQGVTWKLADSTSAINQLKGVLRFKNDCLQATAVRARFLGQPLNFEVNTQVKKGKLPTVVIKATGALPASVFYEDWPTLKDTIEGRLAYQATFSLRDREDSRGSVIDGQVDLVRATIRGLPAPFNKPKWRRAILGVKAVFPQSTQHLGFPRIDLRVKQGLWGGPFTKNLSVRVSKEKHYWRLAFSGPLAGGVLQIPYRLKQAWLADFEHVHWPKTKTLKKAKLDPQVLWQWVPNLKFTCRDCRYTDNELGAVSFLLSRQANRINIDPINIKGPLLNLAGKGYWAHQISGYSTHFSGNFNTQQLSHILRWWEDPPILTKGQGYVGFHMTWDGLPWELDEKSMKGKVTLDVRNGGFSKISNRTQQQIGFARLLNFLSLQSLPRRLLLDFHDVTQRGFHFNHLLGKLDFKKGDVATQDTQLTGPVAEVYLKGRVGMVKKDYDLTMRVYPKVTSSIPLLAGLLGGPVVGALTWVANKIVSPTLSHVLGFKYRITGPWDQPQFRKTKLHNAKPRHAPVEQR